MSGRNASRLGTALVLALGLAITCASPGVAAGREGSVARIQGNGPLEWAWGWLSAWWFGQDGRAGQGLSRIWGEAGPEMDPDGATATRSTPVRSGQSVCANTDMGPGMDPDGSRAAVACADAGPGMDPNGGH